MHAVHRFLVRFMEITLVIIFGLMVVDVLWQVFSRYVLDSSSSFTEEFARFALIWLTLLGAAYLNSRREHLTMDFLTQRLAPEARARRGRATEWWMFAFSLIVLVVGGGYLVYTTLRLGQVSPAIGVPLGVVYAIVPVSGVLICFFCLRNALGIEAPPPAHPANLAE